MASNQTIQKPPQPDNLWREYITCLFIMVFFATGGGAFLLLIVGYLEKRAVPVTEIGSVMSLLSIVEGGLCLLIGHIYKGKFTREILIGALLTNLTGSLILSTQPLGVLVWVGAACTGAGFGFFTVIMYVAVLQRRPENLGLGLAVGLYTACIAGGNGLGALAGGWITDEYSFVTSFTFSAICYGIALLGLVTLRNHPVRAAEPKQPAGSQNLSEKKPQPSLWLFAMLTAFTLSSINMVFDILFPVYSLRAGMTFTLVGTLSGIKMVLAAIVRPFSGAIMSRVNPIRLNNLSLAGLAAGTVLIPFAGLGAGLTAVIALMGATFGSVRTTSATLVVKDQTDQGVVSRRISYYNTCLTLGQTVSPWLIGLIADRVQVTTSIVVVPMIFLGFFGAGSLLLPQLEQQIRSSRWRKMPYEDASR